MFDYTIDEQGVSLENERACYRRFLSLEQIEKLDASNIFVKEEEEKDPENKKEEEEDFASQDEDKEEPKDEKDETEEEPEDNKEEEEFVKDEKEEEEEKESNSKDDEENEKNVCVIEEEDKEKEKDSTFTEIEGDINEQEENTELQETEEVKENFTASAPELTNSEREELEAYRLKERVSLVDSYRDDLDADTISSFKELAKTVSYSELEAKLAIKYREVSKNNVKNEAPVFSFNTVVTNTNNTPKSYADLVRATLNK